MCAIECIDQKLLLITASVLEAARHTKTTGCSRTLAGHQPSSESQPKPTTVERKTHLVSPVCVGCRRMMMMVARRAVIRPTDDGFTLRLNKLRLTPLTAGQVDGRTDGANSTTTNSSPLILVIYLANDTCQVNTFHIIYLSLTRSRLCVHGSRPLIFIISGVDAFRI